MKKAERVNEDNEGKISVVAFGKVSVISEECVVEFVHLASENVLYCLVASASIVHAPLEPWLQEVVDLNDVIRLV